VFQLFYVFVIHLSLVLIQLDENSVEIHNLRFYSLDPNFTSI